MISTSTPDPRATNAARHGILANTPVIPGMESEADWQRHRDGILASLAPANHLQAVLAERIALQLWRLARVARYEADVTTREREHAQHNAPASYDPPATRQQKVRRALLRLALPQELELEKIQRYEAHLSRELYRALKEYKSLQSLPTAPSICTLQSPLPNLQSDSQNCETNAERPSENANPTSEDEPTASLEGMMQGMGRHPSPQPVGDLHPPTVYTKNCETNTNGATRKRTRGRRP